MLEDKAEETAAQNPEVHRLSNRELNTEAKALMQRAEDVLNKMPEFRHEAGGNFFSGEGKQVFFVRDRKIYTVFSTSIPTGSDDVLKMLFIDENQIDDDRGKLSIHLFANELDIDLTKIQGLHGTIAGGIEYKAPESKFEDSNRAIKEVSDYFNRLEGSIEAPINPGPAK